MKNMKYANSLLVVLALGLIHLALFGHAASVGATPEYAHQTGYECGQCHADVIGGGPLTEAGKKFLSDMTAQGQLKPLTTGRRVVRLIVGYLHMLAAIAWFGTIMYVHLLLKPAYASKGLPKGELKLGWVSMIVLLITGTLLTIARIPSWEMFLTTRFGILLGIKIMLFLVMLASALIVTLYIGPRLRRTRKSPLADIIGHHITLEQLSHFDGKDNRPSYIAYKGIVYDVSHARLWKNGAHVMKHHAGNDLTEALKNAPHDEDKVLGMPQVGALGKAVDKRIPPVHERLFYFLAYMNLALIFIIIFVIALWRWW